MKKKIFLPSFILLLMLLHNNNISGQCNTSLTSAASVTNLLTTTGQSFQVSCTGTLGTISFTPTIGSSVDVFNPGEGITVGVRLLNAGGTVLATGSIAGDNIRFRAWSLSTSQAANTTTEGRAYLNIVRIR